MKITFINVSTDTENVHAHAANCRDITRTLRKHPLNEDAGDGEFATQEEAFKDYNADFLAEGSGTWDIRFFPCVTIPAK